ncbi:hypothetical protein GCM10027570_30470 [Streptomonospora sediminis]
MDTAAGDLADAAATLRRRWRLIAACAAGGLLPAVAALLLVPESYTSTTSVHVRPTGIPELTGERSGRTNGEVNLDTEAQIVGSAEVSAAVADRLGPGAEPAELSRAVEVTVPPNSSVLQISFTGARPSSARRASAAFADAYLDYRTEQVDRRIGDTLDSLKDQADSRHAELARLSRRSETGAAVPQGRITAVQTEITELNKQIHPLSALRESVVPGQVITAATTPEAPTSPVAALWPATGGALGLAAGLAAAFAADRRGHRLHTARGIERATGLPVLLGLQTGGRSARNTAAAPVAQRANRAALELAAGIARTRGHGAAGGAVVLVAGISRGSAAAPAATELAAALGRTGSDVLLVRADPAAAASGAGDHGAGAAAADPEPATQPAGLADILLAGADPAELITRSTAVPRLRILGCGTADPADAVQGPAMERLVQRLRPTADYVVIAAAPTNERADACALARSADTAVLVVDPGATRADDLRTAVETFAALGTQVAGTITAAAPTTAARHTTAPATGQQTGTPAAAPDTVGDAGTATSPAADTCAARGAATGTNTGSDTGPTADTGAGAAQHGGSDLTFQR